MKLHFLLFFIFIQNTYSQISAIDKADKYSIAENYSEEIRLRQLILKNSVNKNSEEFKTQNYKLKLAEFHNSEDAEFKLKKIIETEDVFHTLESQDPFVKIEIGIYYTEALKGLQKFEEANTKIHSIYKFAKQQPDSPKIKKERAAILINMGDVAFDLADYEKSIAYTNQALIKYIDLYGENSMEAADVYRDLAEVYSFTDNFLEGLSNLEKAADIYERLQPDDKFILFKIYALLFERYKLYGDLDNVESLFQKLNQYYEINKNNQDFINTQNADYPNLNPVKTVYLYIQLQHAGMFNEPQKVENAFNSFIESMPSGVAPYNNLELNTIVSYHFETGYFFHKLDDYSDVKNYHKAKNYYNKALKFTQNIDFEFGEMQAYWILSTLGVDYKQWNDVILATEKAFKIPSIKKFNALRSLKHNLALAYGGMHQYDKAKKLLDEEYLEYLNGTATSFSVIDNLRESGELYIAMYKANPQAEFLKKAYNNFHLCSVIFSRLYRGGEFSQRLTWYQNRINEGMLRTASMMNKNQKAVAERVEINNSDYLWSSFLNNRKEPFKESSLKLQKQLDSLDLRKDELVIQLKSDTLQASQLSLSRSDLKKTEKSYRELNRKLSEDDDSFYQFSRTDFNLEKLQNELKKDEVIIKFIVSHASVFAYTIQKKDITLIELSLTASELKEKVIAYSTALKSAKPEFISLSKELYTQLLFPLNIEKNKHLIIVPQGYLSHIPFETLMASNDTYLIQNNPVSYAYSLKLFDIQKSIKDNSRGDLAVFSPDYSLQYATGSDNEDIKILVRSGNYELIGAKTEAQYVSAIFDGDLFMGNKATKANFMEKSSNYSVLHLAMHAVINEEDANMSNLIFDNNERLYLSELYNMKIPADLAVLSACDTGFGEIKEGEGVQSLSRAFTYAGVKSTVMSLWPVPDRETSVIMTSFYNNLKTGKPKDEALQLAKLNYLQNVSELELKHPYYWAGFIVSGDVTPLDTSSYLWLYIIGGVVLALFILFLYLKRKRYL